MLEEVWYIYPDGTGAPGDHVTYDQTIYPDKNYVCIAPMDGLNYFNLSAATLPEGDTTYHCSNILFDIDSTGNSLSFSDNITLVNTPKLGKVQRARMEWWGNDIRLYVLGAASGDESGATVYDVIARSDGSETLGNTTSAWFNSVMVIPDGCGSYWDSGYTNNEYPIYTNGKCSLVYRYSNYKLTGLKGNTFYPQIGFYIDSYCWQIIPYVPDDDNCFPNDEYNHGDPLYTVYDAT